MKKQVVYLVLLMIIFSCKNGNEKSKKDNPIKKTGDQKDDIKQKEAADTINNKPDARTTIFYHWKETDKKAFLEDCRKGFEGKADTAKMKDFCSCMLLQAQKYYSDYKQMDENSNDEYERKIFLDCADKYPGDNDDE